MTTKEEILRNKGLERIPDDEHYRWSSKSIYEAMEEYASEVLFANNMEWLAEQNNIVERRINEEKEKCLKDMYLNMQYYMEYCQMKGYVTPQEWIEKHKHF